MPSLPFKDINNIFLHKIFHKYKTSFDEVRLHCHSTKVFFRRYGVRRDGDRRNCCFDKMGLAVGEMVLDEM